MGTKPGYTHRNQIVQAGLSPLPLNYKHNFKDTFRKKPNHLSAPISGFTQNGSNKRDKNAKFKENRQEPILGEKSYEYGKINKMKNQFKRYMVFDFFGVERNLIRI